MRDVKIKRLMVKVFIGAIVIVFLIVAYVQSNRIVIVDTADETGYSKIVFIKNKCEVHIESSGEGWEYDKTLFCLEKYETDESIKYSFDEHTSRPFLIYHKETKEWVYGR